MSDHGTAIQWTHIPGYKGETWNPVTGCDRVSPGCAHCYALDLAAKLKSWGQPRYQKDGDPKTSGPGFGVTLHPDKLKDPLRWKKPRCVFVNSMSDLFHESIPEEFIRKVFGVMAKASDQHGHLFLVLTKRPERMAALLKAHWWPHPGVWLGVTIENRRFVHRADLLRETPAAVRFVSAEPLLGPLIPDGPTELLDTAPTYGKLRWADGMTTDENGGLDLADIDWLITGGESGPKHRRFDPAWAVDLLDACSQMEVAFFHKQNGGPKPTSNGRLLDGVTYDEFPTVAA